MKIFLLILFVILSFAASAQRKIFFSSQNYLGLMEGEHASSFQLQTINGIKYKTWFAGLGTGLDWYYQRSIPLFASLNKDFFQRGKRNFFAAADAGINFPWKDDKITASEFETEKLLPGLYWGAGLGYRVGIGKNRDAILLQLGYNYKHGREKVKTLYYPLYPGPLIESPNDIFDYHLRRLSLKIGWNF